MIKEIDTGSGVLGISLAEAESVKIEYYRGKDITVRVPEEIEGSRVTEIGKKAFLSAKTLTGIELPDGITSIGDWAFASCTALRQICVPGNKLSLGSGLFRDCVNLEKIVIRKAGFDGADIASKGDIPYLLALSVYKMDAPYLFDVEKAGTADWIEHLDSVITQILGKDDSEGFSKMLLCGEEDYVGDDSNLDTYVLLRKKEKIRILLARLIHDQGLSDKNREMFTTYLKENMDKALWPLVLEEHGEDREYFDLLIDIGCINNENVSKLIESMGDHYTQMKGYLIRFKGETGGGDFFGELEL